MNSANTRNIYSGKIITLNIDTVTLPNGVTIDLEMVRHPGAAAVVPLKEDGTVVLIKQFRHAAGGFIYEIPAGKLHPGEDPKDCAARELEEEIGYQAGKLELLSSIFTAPGFTDEVIHVYLAEDLLLQRQIALKAMLPHLAANPTARQRFHHSRAISST